MGVGVQVLEDDNFHIPTTSLTEGFARIEGVAMTDDVVGIGEA